MLIFNTTFHLDDSVHEECVRYLIDKYIPQSLTGGLLEQPSLARIEIRHEEGGCSYAIQFKTKDMDTLNQWAAGVGASVQKGLADTFGNKVTGFSTLLEEIPL